MTLRICKNPEQYDLSSPVFFDCHRMSCRLLRTRCAQMQDAQRKRRVSGRCLKDFPQNLQCQNCEQGADIYFEIRGIKKEIKKLGKICRVCGEFKPHTKFADTPHSVTCDVCRSRPKRGKYHPAKGSVRATEEIRAMIREKLNGTSQHEFARRAGVHQSVLSHLLSGKRQFVQSSIVEKIRDTRTFIPAEEAG